MPSQYTAAYLTGTFLQQSLLLVGLQTDSDSYKWFLTCPLSSSFCTFFISVSHPLVSSFIPSLTLYLLDHLPLPLVASPPPPTQPSTPISLLSPTSFLSSISLTSPELWGIQDRQVAVVTGKAGIFNLVFFLFSGECERKERRKRLKSI